MDAARHLRPAERPWGKAGPPASGASFLARRPIYDRELVVVAYELLFREGDRECAPQIPDPGAEESRTLIDALDEIGLDAIVGGRLGFVSVTRRFVLDDHALFVPAGRVALEVLEDVEVCDLLLAKLRSLARRGYLIVLDGAYDGRRRELLELAQLAKVDVAALGPDEVAERVAQLEGFHLKLVAANVDDYETFELCKELGFHYFEGDFYRRPKTVETVEIPPASFSKLQLIATLQDPTVELEQLDAIIGRDVGLSYRLLRLINSAFFYLPRRVESVRHALVLLGQRSLKNWASLLVLADIEGRPSELAVTAMVRARMCELVAAALERGERDVHFAVGLFSVLDAFVSAPLEQVLEELPFTDAVKRALLEHAGPYGDVLATVLDYEAGNFDEAGSASPAGLPLRDLYLEAIAWADEARAQLSASS